MNTPAHGSMNPEDIELDVLDNVDDDMEDEVEGFEEEMNNKPVHNTARGPRSPRQVVPTKTNEESIQVSASDFNRLMENLQSLKEKVDSFEGRTASPVQMPFAKQATEMKVRLSIYENKVVVGFKDMSKIRGEKRFVYSKQNPDNKNEWIEFITLILEDGTEVEITYNEYIKYTSRIVGLVQKIHRRDHPVTYGTVMKKGFDEKAGVQYETNEEVPLAVLYNIITYDVIVEDQEGNTRLLEDIIPDVLNN